MDTDHIVTCTRAAELTAGAQSDTGITLADRLAVAEATIANLAAALADVDGTLNTVLRRLVDAERGIGTVRRTTDILEREHYDLRTALQRHETQHH